MVVLEKCPDYNSDNVYMAVKKAIDRLGGINKYVKQGMKVLIKPNLVMKKSPDEAATTHPSVVEAVARIVSEAGGNAIIADNPGGIITEKVLKGIYSVCGMKSAAEKSGAQLNYDLEEAELQFPGGKYLKKVIVSRPFAEADIIINVPKLKSHGQMVYTGAVKNMFGAVPGVLKAEYHFRMQEHKDFANALIDIFLSTKPSLNIMDAVVGMDGHGPTAGDPKPIGLILAGENAFELDYTALNVIGVSPFDVPIIREAVERKLCPSSIEDISIEGVDPDSVRIHGFKIPHLGALRTIRFFDNRAFNMISKALRPSPVFIHGKCIGCGECAKNCPAKIIEMIDRKPVFDISKCIRCFCCQELCPVKAVTSKKSIFTYIKDFQIKCRKKFCKKKDFSS
ncbi:MAG TPA: DUF362 domain-containing protein [Clostridiaceae bacterium]|nr:DUF362 domain-containing protein [Clostridiaceae bacterium]